MHGMCVCTHTQTYVLSGLKKRYKKQDDFLKDTDDQPLPDVSDLKKKSIIKVFLEFLFNIDVEKKHVDLCFVVAIAIRFILCMLCK